MARAIRRSSSTALAFIDTSMQPIIAPMTTSATDNTHKFGASTAAASVPQAAVAKTCKTARLP